MRKAFLAFCLAAFASLLALGGGCMMCGARVGAWANRRSPQPSILDGVSFYLDDVPAGTTLVGTTGKVASGGEDVVVDWGDGETSVIHYSGNMTIPAHTYSEGGDFVININGADLAIVGAAGRTYFPIFTEIPRSGLPYLVKVTVSDGLSIGFGQGVGYPVVCSYCQNLKEVYLGDSVASIGASCFSSCAGLQSITSKNATPPVCATLPFSGVSTSIPIYVPSSSVDAYKSASGWSVFTNILPIQG